MYNTCNTTFNLNRSSCGCNCGCNNCNGCNNGSSWWNSGFQSICRDCNGNIRVNGNNGCGCGCGCNGNGTSTTENGNGNGNGFTCVSFCGNSAQSWYNGSTNCGCDD